MLGDAEYDRLFVTVLTPASKDSGPGAKTLELRYGEPSEPK